jgi:D-3-phosphoglycerate dehydrogenase / 2-oxoglutarate reductase
MAAIWDNLSKSSLDETTMQNKKEKVLLLENIHADAQRAFEAKGYQVESLTKSLSGAALRAALTGVTALGIRSKTEITPELICAAPQLTVIGAFCIGTDKIDLSACAAAGVPVFNAPYSNTRSVAELALGHMLVLLRFIPDRNNEMHRGIWKKTASGSTELRGKTLGIIGYGNIGAQLSVLAESLGMNVVFFDSSEKLSLGNAVRMDSMAEVLRSADVVSVHVSGSQQNVNLIGAAQFEMMKKDAIFINLSRGYVVEIEALAAHLRSGKLKGAAVDVFPVEPDSGEVFQSPLQGLANTILTPHIAGSTQEAQKAISGFVSNKMLNYLTLGDTRLSVNFPHAELPHQPNSHRILHIHKNIAGVIAGISHVLAAHDFNITGETLRTTQELGYALFDVSGAVTDEITAALRAIPGTLGVRILY